MSDDLRVHVRGPADRTFWMLQWKDPVTGLTKSRSSQVRRIGANGGRTEAVRAAARLQADLECGLSPGGGRMSWEAFRERYETEHMPSLKAESAAKIQVIFGLVDRILHAKRLIDVGERQLSHLAAALRTEAKSESTIHSYLATLKAILNWARRQKLINACPEFPRIQRRRKSGSGDLMKGRPPTREEFDRMLLAVSEVIGSHGVDAWTHYLEGLWLSGLRLSESLDFWWDREDRLHPVFPQRAHPYLRVFAESEKGHADRHLPMTPDFAAFLQRTPLSERRGRVFELPGMRPGTLEVRSKWAGKLISKIGERARVVVAGDLRDPDNVKFASAHDLRRAFGARWAALVEFDVLRELMRHESSETTLRFYVGRNAARTAEACHAAWAAQSGDLGRGRVLG
jgi:integrase